MHTVCAVRTEEFLIFSGSRGNDIITPYPEYQFSGLSTGDKWCLCALCWLEAYRSNCVPPVFLEAANGKTLKLIPLEILISKALKNTE
ncbi:hypothetical protein SAMN03080617_00805 [Algoriphagus alkaliphilus]|uniref:DUF2237 domain-containing protein n=1 Tax=Algoriphagus alkaliphilus TaxID=279824 RepID=A0A1G5W2H0_9BACT|nr:hypothetical protein SAMN03080617_00805 [Algoriphagus alkaliphilus]